MEENNEIMTNSESVSEEVADTPKKRTRRAKDKVEQEKPSVSTKNEKTKETKKEVKNTPKIQPEASAENITTDKEEKLPTLTSQETECLKRCLGWTEANPPRVTEKGEVLLAYRNQFFTPAQPYLEAMVAKGLLEKAEFGENGITHKGYRATTFGAKCLEQAAKIRIQPVRKRNNVYEPVYFGAIDINKVQKQ